jgi:hypothetical protein
MIDAMPKPSRHPTRFLPLAPLARLAPLALLTLLALTIAVALLAACQKSEAPPAATSTPAGSSSPAAPAAPTAGAAPGAAPAGQLKVAALSLGKSVGADNRVTAQADTFAPLDTVYASVGTTGGSTGAKLTARWSSVSRSGAESSLGEESKTITPAGDAATEFHVAPPSGLTPGDYKVEILLDGQSVAVKAFRVAK